jgi:glutamine amidotransferase-like uncharacterized protein
LLLALAYAMKKAAAMPASLKERSSRLQMFARPKSDNNVNTTTNLNVFATAAAQQNYKPARYQSSSHKMARSAHISMEASMSNSAFSM